MAELDNGIITLGIGPNTEVSNILVTDGDGNELYSGSDVQIELDGTTPPSSLVVAISSTDSRCDKSVTLFNDGNGIYSETAPANSPDVAPTISIELPLDGAELKDDGSGNVDLRGQASDSEDGDLSAQIAWTSDIDGSLGTGSSITAPLSFGEHTVTASVTDSFGNTATAEVKFSFGPA